MSRISRICCSVLLASTALSAAQAQTPEAPDEAGEIIVTGTRAVGTLAAESAAPVQLLGADALSKVGQPNLNQALTQLVPSFQAQTQGTDMSSFSLSARLRGLSPNHTLVLVNGKRRHGNAILQVINGAFGGSAAPSIDLIPPDAVQRIEIFQEGAAAVYGSDAIAGVINIIMKNQDSGGTAQGSIGEYYDGEGRQYSASGNFGLPVGDAGFVNVTLFHRRNDVTTIGEGQTSVRNLDGSTVTLNATNAAFQPIYNALNANNGTAGINGGQPRSQLSIVSYNSGYDFGGGIEIYSFGDYSYRDGSALQGYRPPNRICPTGASAAFPLQPSTCYGPTTANGMVPNIEVNQNEFSLTGGIKFDMGGWNIDASSTYAEDEALVYTTNSANASLYAKTFSDARDAYLGPLGLLAPTLTPAQITANRNLPAALAAGAAGAKTPRDFYDGGFKFTQYTGTIDVRKDLEVGFDNPLTLAFGGELRKETYRIYAGDELSRFVEGGQSFPGYALSDAATSKRTAKALYANVIFKPVPEWSVDIAGRYENYSDFGDTQIGKITTRYDFSDAIAIRGTASTGFRAPTLQESGYSSTNVGPTSATLALAPNSAASAAAGFGNLRPEKSTNLSAGFVLRPVPKLVISLDGYFIKIKDRIVSTGSITGQRQSTTAGAPGVPVLTPLVNGQTPAALVAAAIAASGKELDPTVLATGSLGIQTFTNGIDTETKGIEFSARYPIETDFGRFDMTWGMNYNDQKVTNNKLGTLFNASAEAIIETSSPKFKSVFSSLFTTGAFSANARATYYSKSTVLVSPAVTVASAPIPGNFYQGVVKGTFIFDLELGYDITPWAALAIGANNLFDKVPEIPDLVPAGTFANINATNGTSPYINGTTSINNPYTHGAYGTNGGYYYARLTFKF
ncbi:MAG: TonB-dependent receptor [Sphingobium sp.]